MRFEREHRDQHGSTEGREEEEAGEGDRPGHRDAGAGKPERHPALVARHRPLGLGARRSAGWMVSAHFGIRLPPERDARRHVSPIFVTRAPRWRGSGPHAGRDAEGQAGQRRSAGGTSSRRAGKPGWLAPACKRSRDSVAQQVADTTSKRLERVRTATASRSASAVGNRGNMAARRAHARERALRSRGARQRAPHRPSGRALASPPGPRPRTRDRRARPASRPAAR